MGSISKPFFRFPLSEGPEAGGQHRATEGPTILPVNWPQDACLWSHPLQARQQGPQRFHQPLTNSLLAPLASPGPNFSFTSQVAIGKDTEEGQGVAVHPVEGIGRVQALEQVSDVAHVDSGLAYGVRLWWEGGGRVLPGVCSLLPPTQHREVWHGTTTGV